MASTMLLLVTDADGNVVNDGDTIVDFRGDPAVLVQATRARVTGKSGKILFQRRPGGMRQECYDKVFNLTVSGILDCGCPHAIVWDEGHQEGCAEREEEA